MEIRKEIHSQLVAIQRHCRQHGKLVPTIPFLVNHAIENGMKATVDEFMGDKS